MSLRFTPMSPSINRPILLLGCERSPLIWIGILCAALMLTNLTNWINIVAALSLWFISLKVLRLLAKKDPHLIQIYFRRLQYNAYYPAVSRALK